jgi:outer membrane protein
MKKYQSFIAVLCVWSMALPPSYGQERKEDTTPRLDTESPHWYSRFTNPYQPRVVPPVNVSNTTRLDSLLRAGNLYLSLQDAMALAIENNLDVEVQRYEYEYANADLLRAKAGASVQGIPTGVTTGMPTGAAGLIGSTNAGLAASGAQSSLPIGVSLDPALTGSLNWGHTTTPLSNTVVSGLTEQIATTSLANFGITQGFITGGSATLGFNNQSQTLNSYTNVFNPATTSNLDLSITQPLLQGFGLAMNRRTIRIATNNMKAADLVFKQQVINVVANVAAQYWNLVYYNSDLEVKRRAVAVSTKLLNDNKAQVEVGTLAPIAIVQAEAQVASDQQALVQSQTNVLQQETILKSALSRNGLASPAVSSARIIPTDHINIPDVEAIEPIQDLISRALDGRPEVAQSRIQIDNTKINLQGIRNQMLPTLNAVADLRNNALAGSVNGTINPATGLVPIHNADPFFLGGYGTVLGQLFSRNFPNYSVGVQLNIPLRNRAAQANMITQELNLRQNELSVQRLINQIRVDVQTALTAVQQSRAQYQAAVKARVLQEQTADAEAKKLAVGASTPYNVILMQRDLWQAEDVEVQAQAAYALARTQLDWATGAILNKHNIVMDEAKAGRITRPPDAIPPLTNNNQQR